MKHKESGRDVEKLDTAMELSMRVTGIKIYAKVVEKQFLKTTNTLEDFTRTKNMGLALKSSKKEPMKDRFTWKSATVRV